MKTFSRFSLTAQFDSALLHIKPSIKYSIAGKPAKGFF
jgi:hypothetical protein